MARGPIGRRMTALTIRPRLATLPLLLLLALPAALPGPDGAAAADGVRAVPALERSVLSEINRVRGRHGLPRLAGSRVLAGPARAHSRRLARTGTLTHDGVGGAPFWHRYVAAGFPRHRRMTENAAALQGCGGDPARQTVDLWMASPPHRANLLDRGIRVAGIGSARGGGCRIRIVTAAFGS